MPELGQVAQMVRSKNAGPFLLSFNVLFDNAERFEAVKTAGIFTKERISNLYDVPPEAVDIYPYAPAHAFVIVIPRRYSSGSPDDRDAFGCQHHAALCRLRVPDEVLKPSGSVR